MIEEWKPISGYEGIFSVSSLGRIRNECVKRGNQYVGKIRIGKKHKDNYLSIRMCHNYKVNIFRIHNLVAKAFIGERPENYVVNHKDGDKANNKLENLEYLSRSQNAYHAVKMNRWPDCRGSKHYASRFKDEDIKNIRDLYKKGEKQKSIAIKFNTNQCYISQIVNNKRWSHV